MTKNVLEGELVEDRKVSNKKAAGGTAPVVPTLGLPGWRLLLCAVPILGLVFAIFWFYYERSKSNVTVIFTIVGLAIAIFSTTTFIVLRFILKAVF